jgi:hypothetical protein
MSAPLLQDKQGGFMGLIIGGILLFVALYGIVHLTNVHYAKLSAAEKPAAAAPAP